MSENLKPPAETKLSTSQTASDPLTLDTSLLQAAEARMRRALGLEGGMKPRQADRPADSAARNGERFAASHKRRFVHDGEVPVTMVGGRRDGQSEAAPHRGAPAPGPTRLEAAEAALTNEASARHQAERALADAQATIRDLQTKLGHAELARIEAVDGQHRAQQDIIALRAELHACEERVRLAEVARRGPRRVEAGVNAADADPAAVAAQRRPSSQRKKPERKSRLVRWWVKDAAQAE